jgi:hypothetical protein
MHVNARDARLRRLHLNNQLRGVPARFILLSEKLIRSVTEHRAQWKE